MQTKHTVACRNFNVFQFASERITLSREYIANRDHQSIDWNQNYKVLHVYLHACVVRTAQAHVFNDASNNQSSIGLLVHSQIEK